MSIDDYRDHAEINCGPTHHHACACREAAVAKLVEALTKDEEMEAASWWSGTFKTISDLSAEIDLIRSRRSSDG